MVRHWTLPQQFEYQELGYAKTVDNTRGFLVIPALEEHCNEDGRLQAGYLLKLIDIAGTMPVFRLVDGAHDCVTASLDRTSFIGRINAWDYIILDSRITKVFNTSVEVQVCVYAVNYRSPKLKRRPVAMAHLIYVGLNDGKKVPLPPIKITELAEHYRGKEAELRRQNRFAESKQTPFFPIQEDDAPFVTEYQQHMTRRDTNAQGNVFGGVILKIVGKVAHSAAKKQALDAWVVGASIDRMSFIEPAFVGEDIIAKAVVTQTWNSSMEVQVEVYAVNPNLPGRQKHIATSTVVYVRINEVSNYPGPVPPWEPQTEVQKQRAQQADLRRKIRLEERKQAEVVKKREVSLATKIRFTGRQFIQRLLKAWAVLTS